MIKKAYFFSGLGAKCSIFDKVILSENYQKVYLEWINPLKNESLISYCKRIAESMKMRNLFLLDFLLEGLLFKKLLNLKIQNILF